jgi:hypothetical protein
MGVLPGCEGLAVAPLVRPLTAKREKHEALGAAVYDLSPQLRRYPNELAALEAGLLALDEQRERPLEHEVDLFLARVPVNPTPLAGSKHDLVQSERRDAELAAKRDETLAGVGIEASPRGS